jgi:hypothetical protein
MTFVRLEAVPPVALLATARFSAVLWANVMPARTWFDGITAMLVSGIRQGADIIANLTYFS